ncbi:MAG TPA: ABC transporter ATP-binding protein, partial [Trueperaceae bacterium]|nr:ABC transporter ATP-binding protein [Trueperaceae bacterium]
RPVIRDLSFQVNPGEVYALVGPNGAGKTTVIRLVSGLAFPTSGTVRLLGKDPHQHPSVRRSLGAVVEAPAAFYPYMTGRGNLRLHGNLAGDVPDERIDEVLRMMELDRAADRKVGIYSLGMRQRLGVAAAMLTRPEVLILDEPASGMDPLSLHLVHSVLQQAAQAGAAVLISTHHLDEVVAYCTRVAILEEGALIDEVNLFDRRERFRAEVTDAARAKAQLETAPYIKHVAVRGDEIVFIPATPDDVGRVSVSLAEVGVGVLEMSKDTFDLRAYYRDRVGSERVRRTGTFPAAAPDGTNTGRRSDGTLPGSRPGSGSTRSTGSDSGGRGPR